MILGAAALIASSTGCAGETQAPTAPQAVPNPATPADSTFPQVPGLVEAERRLTAALSEYDDLDVSFGGDAVDVTPPVVIDIEWGNGHGGTLDLARLRVGPTSTDCEHLSWRAYRNDPTERAGDARRATVATATFTALLDDVRALSRAKVTERSRDGGHGSSADFFVLVRVCGRDSAPDRTWEFCGYRGSLGEVKYAAPEAVVRAAQGVLKTIGWVPIPQDAYRQTHFPDAFARNGKLYAEDFHWWVMERSVEALGWFGDRTTLATLTWMQTNLTDLHDRQVAKVRHARDEPATYLEGPPREIPER